MSGSQAVWCNFGQPAPPRVRARCRRPEDCAEILQQVFDGYRPRRHRDVPSLVPAGIEWTPATAGPAFALCGFDDSGDFLLFTFTDASGGTDAGIFPLGRGPARLALRVVGHWQQRDSSLSSIGTWAPGTVRLTPPPVGDVLVEETLQAAGYPLTPENSAKLARTSPHLGPSRGACLRKRAVI